MCPPEVPLNPFFSYAVPSLNRATQDQLFPVPGPHACVSEARPPGTEGAAPAAQTRAGAVAGGSRTAPSSSTSSLTLISALPPPTSVGTARTIIQRDITRRRAGSARRLCSRDGTSRHRPPHPAAIGCAALSGVGNVQTWRPASVTEGRCRSHWLAGAGRAVPELRPGRGGAGGRGAAVGDGTGGEGWFVPCLCAAAGVAVALDACVIKTVFCNIHVSLFAASEARVACPQFCA